MPPGSRRSAPWCSGGSPSWPPRPRCARSRHRRLIAPLRARHRHPDGLLASRGDAAAMPPRDAWASSRLMGFVGIFVHQMIQVGGPHPHHRGQDRLAHRRHPGLVGGAGRGFLPGGAFGAAQTGRDLRRFAGAAAGGDEGGLPPGEVLALPATRGDLLVLATTVNWAIYTILGRTPSNGWAHSRPTAGAMLAGSLMLLPFFVARPAGASCRGCSATA